MNKINFSAGPSILPEIVIQGASEAILNLNNSGLSLLEISHRSQAFTEILSETKDLVRELLELNDDYAVLFMTGGASSQFCLVPINMLDANGKPAAYIDTGKWSEKAIKEAKLFGQTEIVASSAADGFSYIPNFNKIGADYSYLHITTNNTVCGTQFTTVPESDSPIVADMSSDIFSKPMDGKQYGLIYAGAQKNMGPAGTTLVVVRKDLLGKVERQIPTMLDYRTHIKSLFNTPPVFSIYGCYLTLKWVKEQGLAAIETNNNKKAALLYNEIDRNGLFRAYVREDSRSKMNVTFLCKEGLDSQFLDFTEQAGCVALKGHRSLGGFRASIYNAMNIDGVKVLVDVMREFERRFG